MSSRPASGGGVHSWLYEVAQGIHHWRTDTDIHQFLHARTRDCKRLPPEREIREAIADSKKCAWDFGNTPQPPSQSRQGQLKELNPEKRAAVGLVPYM